MRRLALVEHQPRRGVRLTRTEREALRAAVPELLMTPSAGQAAGPGKYDVTPGSWVGVAAAGDLVVEVAPKLEIDHVLFLVSYALDPDVWHAGASVQLQARVGLVEAVAALFCLEVRRALRFGLLHGYVTREEALPSVRGRVRMDDQLRSHFGRIPPVQVRFDELTEDVIENRVLKAALELLANMPLRARAVAAQVRHLLAPFARVSGAAFDRNGVPEVSYTRLNERYRRALDLARLILRGGSLDARIGATHAVSCLLDMDRLFEDFVVAALRESLSLSEWSFPRGSASHEMTLDRAGAISLEPDLSWWGGGRCTFVGDVKYKRTTHGEQADLYQLLAYATAAQLPGGLLVYAAGDDPSAPDAVHDVDGKRLHVAALDLALPPDQLLSQIAVMAQRVKRLRSPAHTGAVA